MRSLAAHPSVGALIGLILWHGSAGPTNGSPWGPVSEFVRVMQDRNALSSHGNWQGHAGGQFLNRLLTSLCRASDGTRRFEDGSHVVSRLVVCVVRVHLCVSIIAKTRDPPMYEQQWLKEITFVGAVLGSWLGSSCQAPYVQCAGARSLKQSAFVPSSQLWKQDWAACRLHGSVALSRYAQRT